MACAAARIMDLLPRCQSAMMPVMNRTRGGKRSWSESWRGFPRAWRTRLKFVPSRSTRKIQAAHRRSNRRVPQDAAKAKEDAR